MMYKRKAIFILIIFFVFILCGFGIFYFLDNDHVLTLPIAQKINTSLKEVTQQKNQSPFNHVAIIMMENKSYSDIVGNSTVPYINSLLHTYSFADNYHAVSHPSLPNYLALISGTTFGIKVDCSDCFINAKNITDQLESIHKTWKAYMESLPTARFVGNTGDYAQKHDPFIYFNNIRNNTKQCNHIVPYSQLFADLKSENTTPNFMWITPNLCDDMHNCSAQTGDSWLSEQVPKILHSQAFTQQNSLLVILWDENDISGENRVPAIFIGNSVKKGFVTHNAYTHYSLLHTIESLWNLPPLTSNTSQSTVISDIFK